MTGHKPLIGVTPWYDYDKRTTYIKDGYCEGILKAGGLAAILPMTTDFEVLDEILERFDGFLISGGPDVDPRLFGELNLPCSGNISPYRDRMEIYLSKKALERNKPVFGICRGIQVMNVAMGGTLYQDIASQVKTVELVKHSQEAPRWYPTHEIEIEKNSLVWNSFGENGHAWVNSYHHQAVRDVAPGFKVSSTAPDGIIESIESAGHKFAVGVQWHPELMWEKDPSFLGLFGEFVRCCK